ncbi:MAG: hypothetical protein NTW21_44770 [Verrucomicrobia bacterium]|nr:hypothetical protein [Verrucomicrobiota bacterium]
MNDRNIRKLKIITMAALLLPGIPLHAADQGKDKTASDALPRPTAAQARWQDYEIGIFYHYDINCCMPFGWSHRS